MIARTHKVKVKTVHLLTHTPCSSHFDPDDIGFFSVLNQRRQDGSFVVVVVVVFCTKGLYKAVVSELMAL